MTDSDFETLKKKLLSDLDLNASNLTTKTLSLPNLYQTYLNIFSTEFAMLKTLQTELDKLYTERYHYYQFEYNFKLDTKHDLEIRVKADSKYQQLLQKCNSQENLIKFLEKTLENIRNLNFSIKNYIEFKKFQAGSF